MSTELTQMNDAETAALDPISAIARSHNAQVIDPILSLSQDAKGWIYGSDGASIDSPFDAVAMRGSLFMSHVCWKNRGVIDEHAAPLLDHYEQLTELKQLTVGNGLKDHGPYERERDGWSMQIGGLLWVPSESIQMRWRMNLNNSGVNALARVAPDLYRGAQEHPGQNPIFVFSVSSYDNKRYDKKIYVPTIALKGWEGDKKAVTLDPSKALD